MRFSRNWWWAAGTGDAFTSVEDDGGRQIFDVPLDLLKGETLELLVRQEDPDSATALQVMGLDRRNGRGIRLIITPKSGEPIESVMPGYAWRPIDQADPDRQVDKLQHFYHSGRYRYRPVVSSVEGAQRELLLRIPLPEGMPRTSRAHSLSSMLVELTSHSRHPSDPWRFCRFALQTQAGLCSQLRGTSAVMILAGAVATLTPARVKKPHAFLKPNLRRAPQNVPALN